MALKFGDIIVAADKPALEKLKNVVPGKEPPRVVFQNPPPGSPLLKGMTVEVRLLSPSDVTLGDIFDDAPEVFKGVPIPEFKKFLDGNPATAEIIKADTLPPDKQTVFLNNVNTGLGGVAKGTVSAADANKAFNALKMFGRM